MIGGARSDEISQVLWQPSGHKFCVLGLRGVISPSTVIRAMSKIIHCTMKKTLQRERKSIHPSIHLPPLSWWDAIGNASPTGHTRTHKEWTAVGLTQDYLCLTCLSPSAACCSWPSRCFSLSFFLSFSSSLFHTHLTHAHTHTAPHHTHLCVLVCTHTHTFQPLGILSLKGIAFEAWIKQMWLCKQCCFFKQLIGLSTDSLHALHRSLLNAGMKTYEQPNA